MDDRTLTTENKENNHRDLYRSKHPGRLLPTASTFGPLPNYGGEAYSLPFINPNKKGGFASGKMTYAPMQKKMILGKLTRASASASETQENTLAS